MSKTIPEFTAIIVTYYTGPSLWQSIDSCRKSGAREIIIVSNGNSPATLDALKIRSLTDVETELVYGHGNIGFAKGCNLGAQKASSKYLLFLNPDAVLLNNAVGDLADALTELPSPSVVGGRLLNEDMTEQRGARRGLLTPLSAIGSMTGLSRYSQQYPQLANIHWEDQPLPDKPIQVPAISGACMFFRRKDFETLGGFDPKYFLHVEDLDICRAVNDAGGSVAFVPTAQVFHFGSTSRANIFRVNWNKANGLVRYFFKHGKSAGQKAVAILLAPLIFTAILTRTALISLRRW